MDLGPCLLPKCRVLIIRQLAIDDRDLRVWIHVYSRLVYGDIADSLMVIIAHLLGGLFRLDLF